MMCYYLNVHFQGQRFKSSDGEGRTLIIIIIIIIIIIY